MLLLIKKLIFSPQRLLFGGAIISLIGLSIYNLKLGKDLAESELQVSQYQTENQKLKDRLTVASSNRKLRESEIEILNRKIIEDRESFEKTCQLLEEIENEDKDPVGKILDRLSDSPRRDGQ